MPKTTVTARPATRPDGRPTTALALAIAANDAVSYRTLEATTGVRRPTIHKASTIKPGTDHGHGIRREWAQQIATALGKPLYRLFQPNPRN